MKTFIIFVVTASRLKGISPFVAKSIVFINSFEYLVYIQNIHGQVGLYEHYSDDMSIFCHIETLIMHYVFRNFCFLEVIKLPSSQNNKLNL